MKAKLNEWNVKERVELVLTLLAVIAGSFAAIGGFLSAKSRRRNNH